MSQYLFTIAKSILLVTALSIDAFVTSFAYGAGRVRIPLRSVTVINIICTVFLSASMALGTLLLPFLPSYLPTAICFVLLFSLGLIKLLHRSEESVAEGSAAKDGAGRETLPPAKAAVLAVALSLDGLAAGFGAGLAHLGVPTVAVLSLISNTAAILGGCHMGNRLAEKSSLDLTWLSGVMLMLLALIKLAS